MLLITCVSAQVTSHKTAVRASAPDPPAALTTQPEIMSAAPVFTRALPRGVMNDSRNTACMSKDANASFCVSTRKRTRTAAPTQAAICIGGMAGKKSVDTIATTVATSH